jgi:hypothetical protein
LALNTYYLSAFKPPTGQQLAAGFGGHPFAESVFALTDDLCGCFKIFFHGLIAPLLTKSVLRPIIHKWLLIIT